MLLLPFLFSGNYTQALEDFQECLKLQVKHLDPDSRLLAETHYQLGVTYSLSMQYSKAIESLNSSISVIKNRLSKERVMRALTLSGIQRQCLSSLFRQTAGDPGQS